MIKWMRGLVVTALVAVATAAALACWNAFPTDAHLQITAPLRAATANDPSLIAGQYSKDYTPLAAGFRSQAYRSFCGPASIATVLRAYGSKHLDQTAIFPSLASKLNAFYSGLSLAELAELAQQAGLHSEIVYADTLSPEEFRARLKENLNREGDFVIINYDRRVLKQSGAGHISPVGAYDEGHDAFLVLDQAAYKYPFTWIPASLLYKAVHTRDGDRFRGVLFVQAYGSPH